MKRWALSTAVTLLVTGVFFHKVLFFTALAVFGGIGVAAVVFWLTPLGHAAFAEFERQELMKRRDRLDARLRELSGRGHEESSPGG